MKYKFLSDQFTFDGLSVGDSNLVETYHENNQFKFIIVSLIYVLMFYLLCIMLMYIVTGSIFWIVMTAGLGEALIVTYFLLKFRKDKKILLICKYLIFTVMYIIKYIYVIDLVFLSTTSLQLMTRNVYILVIYSSFFLLILIKINYYVIAFTSVLNYLLIFLITFYYHDKSGDKGLWAFEFVVVFFIITACFYVRYEQDNLQRKILKSFKYNNEFINYIDTFIDNQPNSFCTFNNGDIVYSNSTINELSSKLFEYEEKSISNLSLNNNNNSDKLNFELNPFIETELKLTSLAKDEISVKTKNLFVLKNTKLSFLDMLFNQKLIESKENNKDMSLFEIINFIAVRNDLFAEDGKFYFLGISQFLKKKINEHVYHNVSYRKITSGEKTWVEMLMTDITLSKKIQDMDEVYKVKEAILKKIAHEFKTPLICVSTIAEEAALEYQKNCDNVKQKLEQVSDLSSYTLFLVNDIVSYLSSNNKDESKNDKKPEIVNLNLEIVNFEDILKFSFRILNTLLVYNKDKLQYINPIFKSSINLPLKTDQIRLKQIMLNLISNAVKFTTKGFIKLEADILRLERKQFIIITIEDTGLGIKEEDKSKIFGEGNMLDSHQSVNKMGSGLGLAISYNIAKQMNMELSFETFYGKGTTFTLKIPLNSNSTILDYLTDSRDSYLFKVVDRLNEEIQDTNQHEILIQNQQVIIEKVKKAANLDSSKSIKTLDQYINFDYKSIIKLRSSAVILNNKVYNEEAIKSPYSKKDKILIIDDNKLLNDALKKVTLKVLTKFNKDINLEIIQGADGVDLLKEVSQERKSDGKILLVFTDKNMEYMNGCKAVEIIREWEKENKILKKIICGYSSANEFDNDKNIDCIINKPCDENAMEKILRFCGVL